MHTGEEFTFSSPSQFIPEGVDQVSPERSDPFVNAVTGKENGGETERDGGTSLNNIQDNSSAGHMQRPCKRYTDEQILELETFFETCPRPDKDGRNVLSRELGMEPSQIRFWFENKRKQIKIKHERNEIPQLRAENEMIRAENARLKHALANSFCQKCREKTNGLYAENSRLKEELMARLEEIWAGNFEP